MWNENGQGREESMGRQMRTSLAGPSRPICFGPKQISMAKESARWDPRGRKEPDHVGLCMKGNGNSEESTVIDNFFPPLFCLYIRSRVCPVLLPGLFWANTKLRQPFTKLRGFCKESIHIAHSTQLKFKQTTFLALEFGKGEFLNKMCSASQNFRTQLVLFPRI